MYTLSIVIPAYNVEKYLPACLDSVYTDLPCGCQVVLVDDGSPDRCGEICDEYRSRYPEITKVIHQKNMGIGGARNTGMDAADGEYMLFVDSDDTLEPGALRTVTDAIKTYGTDIVSFPARCVAGDGSLLGYEREPFECGKVLDPHVDKALITAIPALVLKAFRLAPLRASDVRFATHIWYEDMRVTPKFISLCGSAVFLDKPLYNYMKRDGSIMNNMSADRNSEIIDACVDLCSWFGDHGMYEEYRTELEYLIIYHVYLTATVRLIRQAGTRHALIAKFREYTKQSCGDIFKNPYVAAMPAKRRLILRLIDMKMYGAVKLLFKIKG